MDRWLFIHVMKTAGTSFRLMLETEFNRVLYPTKEELEQLQNRWYLHAPELLEHIADGRIDLAQRRIICGHYAANLRDHLPGTWRTVVFLREPVARTLSMIAHRRRNAGIFERTFGKPSISDWLKKEGFVRNQIENYQTKVLSINGTNNVNRYFKVDKEMLANARRNIDSIDLIGLTEYFDQSVTLFEKISGLTFPHGTMHANKARRQASAVSDQDLEAIRRLVPYDLELYALAREKLLARIGTLVSPEVV